MGAVSAMCSPRVVAYLNTVLASNALEIERIEGTYAPELNILWEALQVIENRMTEEERSQVKNHNERTP